MSLAASVGFASLSGGAHAAILYDQMTNPGTTILTSSWVPPNGTDSDTYAWDNFLLPTESTVREVWWIGGGSPVSGFTVRFYTGLAAAPDLQPTITALPEEETPADYLKGYRFNDNANETPIAGTSLNQYHVVLPTTLTLPGNTVFWVKIEGDTVGFPTWGVARATHGRDEHYFRYITGAHMFFSGTGSEAFQLRGDAVPEPATAAALLIGGLATLARRRRNR